MGSARYTAFLSYSHKDAAQARWLHRRLEAYRVPRRLVGSEGERGPVPARLTPIFRDREELPAAGDLSEKVRQALAASDNLIVLCSPSSAASPWVAKEIEAFRDLHPDRPILAAIVDGEPGQCFPAALATGVEPLAADLRRGRDGRRLGFLKLVAGLTGVGLDELVQRDAARHVRRVSAVTAAALAAMLLMSMLTAMALSARAEAERERAEAEGLVEFMLTDLRDRLRGVGRLDAMESVNERVLRRYSSDDVPDDGAERRVRLLRAIGEDEITLGDLHGADAAFRKAHALTAARVDERPQRMVDHARSEYWLGRVHELRKQWPEARARYSSYALTAERVLAREPDNPEFLMDAGSAAVNMGNLHLSERNDYESAQRFYERAVARFRKASLVDPRDPGGVRNQANAYGWLADTFFMRRLWRQSLDARNRQVALMEQLERRYPRDSDVAFRAALARRGAGISHLMIKDKPGARKHLFAAYEEADALGTQDARNAEWQLFRAMLACNLLYGDIGLPRGRTREQLKEVVLNTARALKAEKDPRAGELSRCLAALGTEV